MRKIRAFTLIELMVVMVVISILTSLITTGAFRAVGSAQESRAKSDIVALEAALERYRLDTGVYPLTVAGGNLFKTWLQTDSLAPTIIQVPPLLPIPLDTVGWDGPYMSFKSNELLVDAFLDPWGNPYQYQCPGVAHDSTTNAYDISISSGTINSWD